MARLFEDAGLEKRIFQCFVCAAVHQTYEEFKEHIVDKHEEGREYLICPDCKAPIRDMKVHYKTKHPQRIMPSNVQTRVAVWFDFKPSKDGKKKKVKKALNFRQGDFESKKSGCMLHYRSGLECEFYECLEADGDVESFFAEPLKIPYFYGNEWHNYIPDIRVNFIDGSTELWEIKPESQTSYEQNKCKWAAANNYCSNIGWGFIVLTEDGLGKLRHKIKKQQAMLMEGQ